MIIRALSVLQKMKEAYRTKHIDIRHHYIRDALDRNVVNLHYINTEEQVADGLTKALQRIKQERNRRFMGITQQSA